MTKTKTTASATALHLALPPEGGSLSVIANLEEDAHYLRVTLDKAENFKVAVGVRLNELLVNKFGGNRNALRDWYEENVVQGKAHRTWKTVETYLGVVREHGSEAATEVFAGRVEQKAEYDQAYRSQIRERLRALENENINETNAIIRQNVRVIKSEYDLRKEWLSDMNHLWFKANREWQDKWLEDRKLLRRRDSD